MAKSALQGKVKRRSSLDKEKGPLSDNGPVSSPLTEKVSSKQPETVLGTIEEVDVEMVEPAEQMVPQPEPGEPNRKTDEAPVDVEESLPEAEGDSLAQPTDLSPIDDPLRLRDCDGPLRAAPSSPPIGTARSRLGTYAPPRPRVWFIRTICSLIHS